MSSISKEVETCFDNNDAGNRLGFNPLYVIFPQLLIYVPSKNVLLQGLQQKNLTVTLTEGLNLMLCLMH